MAEYINIHTHYTDNEIVSVINLTAEGNISNKNCFSFGIHPWDIGKVNEQAQLAYLEKLCSQKKIVAVGEIGLDRAIETPLEVQKDLFIRQLEIAEKYRLPVILHSVRTNSDLIAVKKKLHSHLPWIFHGFRGSIQEALQLVNNQCYLSFGEMLLTNPKNQAVLKSVPLEWVFFETDDSDEKIENIYQKAAEIIPIFVADLKEKIFANFLKVFGEQCTKNG